MAAINLIVRKFLLGFVDNIIRIVLILFVIISSFAYDSYTFYIIWNLIFAFEKGFMMMAVYDF